MKKVLIILDFYEKLKNDGVLAVDACEKYKISEPTFYRYIADLKTYFAKKGEYELVCDRGNNCYKLIKL